MATKLFRQSQDMKQEYCASIVRIGEVKPIEGSDFHTIASVMHAGNMVKNVYGRIPEGSVDFNVYDMRREINHSLVWKVGLQRNTLQILTKIMWL